MKRELFKEMYNEMQLNEDQKSRIWNHLEEELIKETAGKRKHFHTTAAAGICICIILIIGVPAVAANTSVLQNIINAFNTLAPAEPKLSDGQKKIYSKYGSELKNEITLNCGTLKLKAIMNDGYNICIPFSVYLKNKNGTETGKLSAIPYKNKILDEISGLGFFTSADKYSPMGQYTALDSKLQEDGAIMGCYLLYDGEKELKEGDILQLKSNKKWEEAFKSEKTSKEIASSIPVISEITIGSCIGEQDVSTDKLQKKLRKGTSINKIQISPISLKIEGIERKSGVDKSVYFSDITIELKDGSTVKDISSSSHTNNSGGEYYPYVYNSLFEAPVNLEDIAGIRIQNKSLDLWIPVTGNYIVH